MSTTTTSIAANAAQFVDKHFPKMPPFPPLHGVFEIVDNPQLRELERSLAYEHATGLIESCCVRHEHDLGNYYDLDNTPGVPDGALDDVIHYLDMRGLLSRDTDNPNIVELRDESEAIC
jgi:hypothetical protein